MSLTHEERQTLRQRRSELVKARYERERRIAARESGYQGAVLEARQRGCAGCGCDLDCYAVDCIACNDRFIGRVRRGAESRKAYDEYLKERRSYALENHRAAALGRPYQPISRRKRRGRR